MRGQALLMLGRNQEALEAARKSEQMSHPVIRLWAVGLRAFVEGNRQECLAVAERLLSLKHLDLEGMYYLARQYARLGESRRALEVLGRAVDSGYYPYPALSADPWLEPLGGAPDWGAILARAEQRWLQARRTFQEAGGDEVLDVRAP